MFERKKIQEINDFFIELDKRREKGIYFYRINGFNEKISEFVKKIYDTARRNGVVIEGRIPNPDEKNLGYYEEIMGMDFQMSVGFIGTSLKKWLPRMNDVQRNNVAAAIYDTLDFMRRSGKNENMLKNAYVKFMCWLYYKFERIMAQLGNNQVPKILYEGDVSNYELLMLSLLAGAGCDVILLQYHGDGNYRKVDPDSHLSDDLNMAGMTPFPENFNLKWVRSEIENQIRTERLYGIKPSVVNCTNAWTKGKGLEDVRTGIRNRGSDAGFYYNCFYRINGVHDKLTYLNELYQFQLELKNSGRKILILDEGIMQPDMNEIAAIRRQNYTQQEQMLLGLSENLKSISNLELQRIMNKAFLDVMLEEAKIPEMNLNKLTNKAVYLLCWIKRYQSALFANWKMPEIACFICFGGCRNENEAMFVRFLAKLPVDVLILNPNKNTRCCLEDRLLLEIDNPDSLPVSRFPRESSDIHLGTAAYHAERELDSLMYQDTGMYRNQQYGRSVSITLQTMYEEIALLWNQELKYRPNFSTVDDVVNIPVIFAKISGVKNGQMQQYWAEMKGLMTEDTYVVKKVPFIRSTASNPIKSHATEFFKNGKVQKAKIKAHPSYQYGFIREEMQEHILDKLQLLIDQKLIKGTFENGTEYTIVATVLNMQKEIVRMLQKFDFTKKNPKLIYINTTEEIISLEDSILAAFLNLAGVDVLFYVPTGYQSVEKYFNRKVMEEHQIGEYVYDQQIPDFDTISTNTRPSWREIIFKRGN